MEERQSARDGPAAGSAHHLLADHAWKLYGAVFAGGTAAYFLIPRSAVSGLVYNVLGCSAAVAILTGARLHRPAQRAPWYLFALAQLLFTAGDVLYYTLPDLQ